MRGRREGWIVAAVVAVGLAFRLPGHLNSGLWYDELYLVIDRIRLPFSDFYTTFGSDNNHPFFSLLAWLSVHVFGESAWALRLPALVFGVASLGMLWIFARTVTTRRQAVVVTALMTISYHHVWFSQNARGYTMLLFWTLAATYFLLQGYDGKGRGNWIFYAVCLAFATYTHASVLAVAFAHGLLAIAVMTFPDSRARLSGFWDPLSGLVLAGVLSLLLHASVLPSMFVYFTTTPTGGGAGEEVVVSEWNSVWWTVRAVANSLGLGLWPGLAALAAAGVTLTIGTLEYVRKDWRIAAAFVLPAVLVVLMSVGMGRPLRPRFFFSLGGFILIILVAGVFRICSSIAETAPLRRYGASPAGLQNAAAVVMVALSLAILPRAYLLPKQDFEGAHAWVEEVRASDEVVLTVGLAVFPYQGYYGYDYPEVASVEELEGALRGWRAAYVLHTLPIFLESRSPDLAERLSTAPEVARFAGGVGEGDVIVLRVEAPAR